MVAQRRAPAAVEVPRQRADDDDTGEPRIGATREDDIPGARTLAAPPAEAPRQAPGGVTFVVRLLLPEGDKRLIEIAADPVKVGSGLDEVGLAGDPRARPGEATLSVMDGKLVLDVDSASTAVYRRIDGEETLEDGDVVLFGDVAAEFRKIVPAPALRADVHVLGGGANSPCGRLAFLRRDGTSGPLHDLPAGKTIVGRTDGHLNFPQDSRLSRRHARFTATEEKVTVEDLDSRNGTYVRVRRRRRLEVGDALRVGSAGVQIRGRN